MTGDAGTPLTAKWQIIELDEAQGIGSVEIEDGFTLRFRLIRKLLSDRQSSHVILSDLKRFLKIRWRPAMVWTVITRIANIPAVSGYARYPSDLTDNEWGVVVPFVPPWAWRRSSTTYHRYATKC